MKAGRWVVAMALTAAAGGAWSQTLTLASTTSTEQSGLFGHLLPEFKKATGIDVKVVAVGSGQAIDMARRGDADALLTHDPAEEERFVAEGYASKRYAVMYNDFVLVGPRQDPAGARGKAIDTALGRLAAANAPFISRGDRSGTHAAENRYWALSGRGPDRGKGYRECGCGMGPALNIAASVNGYALTDRGTWLNFRNRGELTVLVEGDPRLFNPYGVMAVSPRKHPHVKAAQAQRFVDWLISPAGQQAIAGYRVGGEPLFFPNAGNGK